MSTTPRALAWILRFRLLAFGRFLRQNAFALLVLVPLVGGALFAIVDRYLPHVGPRLAPLLRAGDAADGAALVVALLFVALLLPAAVDELYPRRGARALLLTLPVPPAARYLVAWLAIVGRGLALAAGLLLVVLLLARREGVDPADVTTLAGKLAVALPALAALALLVAGALARARRSTAVGTRRPADRGRAERGTHAPPLPPADDGLHETFRPSATVDARPAGRTSVGRRLLAAVTARLPPAVGVQVERDLIDVLRRFSPAVWVAAAAVLASAAGVALYLPRLVTTPFWHGRLALVGAAGGVLAAVSLTPFVLRHQLPLAWLERASGAAPESRWRAKLWLARGLALPAVAAGAIALATVPATPSERALMVVELALVAWVLASCVGLTVFEVPERPLLGLVYGVLLGAALAALMIFYRGFDVFWLIGYVMLAGYLADRATRRVRFTEVAAR